MKVVVVAGTVEHNNKLYRVGDSFNIGKKDGERLIGLKKVEEIADPKKNTTKKKDKNPVDIMQEGELAELQAVAKELEIETEGKSLEELKEEIELAKELELKE